MCRRPGRLFVEYNFRNQTGPFIFHSVVQKMGRDGAQHLGH